MASIKNYRTTAIVSAYPILPIARGSSNVLNQDIGDPPGRLPALTGIAPFGDQGIGDRGSAKSVEIKES